MPLMLHANNKSVLGCLHCALCRHILALHDVYLPCMNMSTHMLKQMHMARIGVT